METYKLLVCGSGASTIHIFDENGAQFAVISTNLAAGQGMAEIDPDTFDVWYKRYGQPTFVIPSSAWVPFSPSASTVINVYGCSSIGQDLIPRNTMSIKIVKRGTEKFSGYNRWSGILGR